MNTPQQENTPNIGSRIRYRGESAQTPLKSQNVNNPVSPSLLHTTSNHNTHSSPNELNDSVPRKKKRLEPVSNTKTSISSAKINIQLNDVLELTEEVKEKQEQIVMLERKVMVLNKRVQNLEKEKTDFITNQDLFQQTIESLQNKLESQSDKIEQLNKDKNEVEKKVPKICFIHLENLLTVCNNKLHSSNSFYKTSL